MCLFYLKQYMKAKEYLQKAIEVSGQGETFQVLKDIYLLENDIDAALQLYTSAEKWVKLTNMKQKFHFQPRKIKPWSGIGDDTEFGSAAGEGASGQRGPGKVVARVQERRRPLGHRLHPAGKERPQRRHEQVQNRSNAHARVGRSLE